MTTTIETINGKLIAANPLFAESWPNGKKDFRGLQWPNPWRGGLYVYQEQQPGAENWKALFGRESDAMSCAATLEGFGIASRLIPATNSWCQLVFDLPEDFAG